LGKNGVKINGVDMKPGNPGGSGPHPLPSQTMLQVGDDLTFYFLLPKDPKDVVRKRKLGWVAVACGRGLERLCARLQCAQWWLPPRLVR
jgi:hypothetical protein